MSKMKNEPNTEAWEKRNLLSNEAAGDQGEALSVKQETVTKESCEVKEEEHFMLQLSPPKCSCDGKIFMSLAYANENTCISL